MGTRFSVAALALVAVAAGCGGGTKAGGRDLNQVVLTIASPIGADDELAEYTAAVRRLSGGSIRLVRLENWRSGAANPDAATLAGVRARVVDLAKIDASVYDHLGVHGFDALRAPFLVDGLGLEEKLLASGLPSAMLSSVRALGVVGVGMLPGPLVHPFGLERRLLGPSTYRHSVVGIERTRLASLTFRSLHAIPRVFRPPDLPPWRFTGAVLDLTTLADAGQLAVIGRSSVTSNVSLWPDPTTIIGNGSVLARLSGTQRRVLQEAALAVLAPATSHLEAEDRAATGTLCRYDRIAIVDATPTQQAALRAAVRPVYAKLAHDPLTRSLLAGIERLRRGSPAGPPLECTHPSPAERAETPLDGTWQMTASRAQAGNDDDAGRYRMVLHRGRLRMSFSRPGSTGWRSNGVFRVAGRRLFFAYADGSSDVYRWNVFRDALTLRLVPGVAEDPRPTIGPWRRSGT